MTLSGRLKRLLTEQPDKSQAGLARATGAKPPSVSDWVSGETKSINSKYLSNAANYFCVNSDWLATGKGGKPVSTRGGPSVQSGMETSAEYALTLEHVVERLAIYLQEVDLGTRRMVVSQISYLIDDPKDYARVAAMMLAAMQTKQHAA